MNPLKLIRVPVKKTWSDIQWPSKSVIKDRAFQRGYNQYHKDLHSLNASREIDVDKISKIINNFTYYSPRTGNTRLITLEETAIKLAQAIIESLPDLITDLSSRQERK